MVKAFFVFLFLALLPCSVFPLNTDSLKNIVHSNATSESKVTAMLGLSAYYLRTDTTLSKHWATQALMMSKKENLTRNLILAHENFARYYTEQGRYDSALYHLEIPISNYDLPEYEKEIGACYISLGNIYDIQSNYEKALDAYLIAEEKYKAAGYIHGLGLSQMGIGNIYNTTGLNNDAKKYFRRSYQNLLKTNEVYASWSMNNLATAMTELGEYDSAVFFFERSLEIKLRNNDIYGASYTYNDLGSLYYKQKEYDKALNYYLKALESKEGLEGISKETISNTSLDIARIYYHQKKYHEGKFYAEKGLQDAIACSSIHYQAEAYRLLADLNYYSGEFRSAFEMLDQFIVVQDSVQKLLYNDNLADMRTKYDADQKEKEIELLNASNKVAQLETEKANEKTKEITIYLITAVIIIVLASILGISLFRSNKAKKLANDLLQKTNAEVLHQKLIVEEKNKEIVDSINYAKRIQNAILPPPRIVEKYLPDSFIFYKPKDIVAGDFYWLEVKNDKVFFAAADCTGHGVPGAMVSVICNNGLNRSVREYNITEPGKILDKTREIVIQEFEKSDDEVRDGMDISLCAISFNDLKLEWAGANNPLWIIRPLINSNNNSESSVENSFDLIEFKPDKQPIGKYGDIKPFTTQTIQLQKGDSIYIFTDGYQDQFGGPEGKEGGKKFKASNLKTLLLKIQEKSLAEQKEILHDTLVKWQGKIEQVDDICLIGVRV